MLLFLYSCISKTIFVAPHEKEKISGAGKIIIITNDGKRTELKNPIVQENRIIGYTDKKTEKEIDFALIKSVSIEKRNLTYPILYAGVALVAGWLLIEASTAPSPPPVEPIVSCPFIYSFDGKQYVFDAEPYGGAICRGLKRAEWCELDHLKEVNGQYKIMIANELNETQYTDEIRLVAVDHPKGTKVVPDISGRIHTFSRPDAPSKAYDSKGKDILPMISANDRNFWTSQLEGRNPEKKEDLKDELIIEFRKPADAKWVKL